MRLVRTLHPVSLTLPPVSGTYHAGRTDGHDEPLPPLTGDCTRRTSSARQATGSSASPLPHYLGRDRAELSPGGRRPPAELLCSPSRPLPPRLRPSQAELRPSLYPGEACRRRSTRRPAGAPGRPPRDRRPRRRAARNRRCASLRVALSTARRGAPWLRTDLAFPPSSFRHRRPHCGATWRPAELRPGRADARSNVEEVPRGRAVCAGIVPSEGSGGR